MPEPVTVAKAEAANARFDAALKAFLRRWIEDGTPENEPSDRHSAQAVEEYVDGGALRDFFKHTPEPFQHLLMDPILAQHLCRTHRDVVFAAETGEPLLGTMEQRLYNLAAHRQKFQVPYRFIPKDWQGAHGDRAPHAELPERKQKKGHDIGDYFSTRRADATVVSTMHRELLQAIQPRHPHVHLAQGLYFSEALAWMNASLSMARAQGVSTPQFYVFQQRYSEQDKHFGAALIAIHPQTPHAPKRIIFCDTVPYESEQRPGWFPAFSKEVAASLGPEAAIPIERASHTLQEPNTSPDPSRHDINCSFYSRSMARALLRLAQEQPHTLLIGSADTIHAAMKQRMKDYYRNATQKSVEEIRDINRFKRWNIGRSMMLLHSKEAAQFAAQAMGHAETVAARRDDHALGIGLTEKSSIGASAGL